MDKSLDEIIATKPKTGRRGGAPRRRATPTARTAVLGKPQPIVAQKVSAVAAGKAVDGVGAPSEKIVVSGLPLDVNEGQIKDLFASTIGPVRELSLSYNAQGRSKGIATVTFSRKGDGNKAYKEYNNRLIDGNQPMKIEIVVDPIRAVPLAARVAAAPGGAAKTTAPQQRTTGPIRRRRGERAPRAPKPAPKTAADLDAEMEDYTAQASAPAAAAAPTATA
ncbi:hypothetical protein FA13DRAFT_1789293 [Coprinellus micaceus]|uniref:RRM domain-containing protein n=1 Tax=Coprinellus micaceus TaxID=71717 RepID=A0A4Y7TIV2_COPMI|nr:hypothetical protein FA13DRAFT_1789293 [Coprinellus micaceus]